MTAVANGARLALLRLLVPVAALVLALATAFVLLAATVERRVSEALATDRTLTAAVFGIVLPLLAFAALERATLRERLDSAANRLARYGFSRRQIALGMLATAALALAAVGAVLAVVAVFASAGGGGAVLRDALTSAWIGAVAGVAYAAWFLLASTVGKHGGGRAWALAIDWVLGSTTTWLSIPCPRGHVQNLLGGPPVVGMPQWAALITLLSLGTIYAIMALARLRD